MIVPSYQAKESQIIVVGGHSGIGQRVTDLLLRAGATVFSIDIVESIQESKHENHHYYQCDVLKTTEMNLLAEEIAKQSACITGLVCLSGTIKHFKPILEQSQEEWQEVFDISFKSCYNACRAFATLLQKADNASIVNMSSGLAFGGMAQYGAYTNAKAAINSFSKTLATELAPNIRVNTVAPGAVNTPFIRDKTGSTRIDIEAYERMVPLGSMAEPDEIAQLILFLLSGGSSHITGQCIHINGGAMML